MGWVHLTFKRCSLSTLLLSWNTQRLTTVLSPQGIGAEFLIHSCLSVKSFGESLLTTFLHSASTFRTAFEIHINFLSLGRGSV